MTIEEKAIEQLERISEHLSSIGEKEDYTDVAIQALEQQQSDEDIHREREQAYMLGYEDASKRFRTQPCEDCISREAVIDFIIDNYGVGFNSLTNGIRDYLPPVTPKRPKGHWIIIDDCELFMAKCSECGEIVDSRMTNKYPYCHCGAEMEGEENV